MKGEGRERRGRGSHTAVAVAVAVAVAAMVAGWFGHGYGNDGCVSIMKAVAAAVEDLGSLPPVVVGRGWREKRREEKQKSWTHGTRGLWTSPSTLHPLPCS